MLSWFVTGSCVEVYFLCSLPKPAVQEQAHVHVHTRLDIVFACVFCKGQRLMSLVWIWCACCFCQMVQLLCFLMAFDVHVLHNLLHGLMICENHQISIAVLHENQRVWDNALQKTLQMSCTDEPPLLLIRNWRTLTLSVSFISNPKHSSSASCLTTLLNTIYVEALCLLEAVLCICVRYCQGQWHSNDILIIDRSKEGEH